MGLLSALAGIIGGILTPAALLVSSLALLPYVKPHRILRPRSFLRTLKDLPEGSRSSPLRALSVALAGTLGVGNITGVASALAVGGPGAVFWMILGSLAVIPVKYAEVSLAVRFRRIGKDGPFGGAMYYIRGGLAAESRIPYRTAGLLGGGFAALCLLNSMITGNLVQANAAACVFPEEERILCGAALSLLTLASLIFGTRRIERITSALIPPLTGLYLTVAGGILLRNAGLLPGIFAEILSCAFRKKAVFGGAAGFSVRSAVRFGIMRGIFSNEAGCGTSPTAHASASAKSPHHQACLGIVEVLFDTPLLCTLTALVLLTAEKRFGILPWHAETDMAPVTLDAFELLAGGTVRALLAGSVALFAFAAILAQIYYGMTAIGYFTDRKGPRILYSLLSSVCPLAGACLSAPVMWLSADLILGIMTAVNCVVLIMLRSLCRSPDFPGGSPRRADGPCSPRTASSGR